MGMNRLAQSAMRMVAGGVAPSGARGKLSILIFHRVLSQVDPLAPDEIDAERFDQLLSWLGRMFCVLPLSEAVERARHRTLPARALSITFDDGYADNHDVALPILQRHGMVATFFVATGFLDGGRMWNDSLIESVRSARCRVLDFAGADGELGRLPVATIEEKREAIGHLLRRAKYLPPDQRERMVAQVQEVSGASLPDDLMMTGRQVRALRAAGMQIGAHTVTHPILTRLSDVAARAEIAESRDYLQELLGESVDLFAYPNGKFGQDYADEHAQIVAEFGFAAAVATDPGVTTSATDPYRLPRFTPWDRTEGRFHARMIMNMK